MEFSLRYPPVQGRLHTRYAPVRRSSAQYCYRLLPLDLHVLSLPLAFILSQDQTLHCKNCSFTSLTRLRVSYIPFICMTTHAISFFSSVSNCSRFQHPSLGTKTAAKIQPFSIPAKYFFNKKLNSLPTICISLPSKSKKININARKHPKKGTKGAAKPRFSCHRRPKNGKTDENINI